MNGDTRESVRGSGRVVVEVEGGITVYPPQRDGEPWRAVFTENGRRRYREAGTEESWPPSWPRSPSGCRLTRRTWSGPART